MDAYLWCLKLLIFSVCTGVSMGQPTAHSSCPNTDDGLTNLILENNQHNKEITSLKEEIIALKNKSSSQEDELAALNKELVKLIKNIAVLNESKEDIYPENCADIYKSGIRKSGVYTLFIKRQLIQRVYCDMDTSTGGWTVFQRRKDGSIPFDKTWEEYKTGFGNLESEFWLGNVYLAMITDSKTRYTLRVDLESFENEKRYAEYRDFRISSEADKYRLIIGSYSGTAGGKDGLVYQNNQQFTTKDQDNDKSPNNCATLYGYGGFWYNNCHNINLNGLYKGSTEGAKNGIIWFPWLRFKTLKHTEMKLKPLE